MRTRTASARSCTPRWAAGDAARDIVASAEANPRTSRLRLGASTDSSRTDREQMASDLVDTAAQTPPTDLSLMMSAGDMFTNAGLHRTAMRYERARGSPRLSPSDSVSPRASSSSRDRTCAGREITQDPNLTSAESPATYMLRARSRTPPETPRACGRT